MNKRVKIKAYAIFMPDGIMLGEIAKTRKELSQADRKIFKVKPVEISWLKFD